MKRPLNIWRIHSDLFTNMAGLILTGGLGMMVLFGGALLRRTPSDDPYPSTCGRLAHVDRAMQEERFAVTPSGCELTAQPKGPWFVFGYSMPRRTSDPNSDLVGFDELYGMATPICRATVYAARIVEGRGRVFIEGHASNDVDEDVIGSVVTTRRCTDVAFQKYTMSKSEKFAITLEDINYIRAIREVCNRQISFERAMNIYYVCDAQLRRGVFAEGLKKLDDSLGSSASHDDIMRTIEISSRSTTAAPTECDGGDAADCARRVSIRVTMNPAPARP